MIEMNNMKGMPLFSRPFFFASNQPPKILKAQGSPLGTSTELRSSEGSPLEEPIIQERGGVHFINNNIIKPGKDAEKNLNREFKTLVDSVLKNN